MPTKERRDRERGPKSHHHVMRAKEDWHADRGAVALLLQGFGYPGIPTLEVRPFPATEKDES